jgi:hypothetical protein
VLKLTAVTRATTLMSRAIVVLHGLTLTEGARCRQIRTDFTRTLDQ